MDGQDVAATEVECVGPTIGRPGLSKCVSHAPHPRGRLDAINAQRNVQIFVSAWIAVGRPHS